MFTNRIAGKAKFAPKAGLKRTRPAQVKNELKASNTNPLTSNGPTPVSQSVSEIDQSNFASDSTNNMQIQNDNASVLHNDSTSSDAYPFDLTPQTSKESSPQHSPNTSEVDSISPYNTNSQHNFNSDPSFIPITASIPRASGLPSVEDILAQNYNNAPQESHVPDSSNDVLQYQISQATQFSATNKTTRFKRAPKPADINEDAEDIEARQAAKPRPSRKQRDPNTANLTPKRACHIYEPHTLNFMNSYSNGVIELNSLPLKVLCNQHVFYGEGFISSNSGNENAIVHDLSSVPAPSQLQQNSQGEDIKSNGPQFKIGADGKFVVDMESVVERKRKQPTMSSDLNRLVTVNDDNRYYNCMTHVKRNKSSRWTIEETNKFYEGLAQWGTDFSMIATMFDNRNRSEIKNKFNREEKKFPNRVTDALLSRPRSRLTTPAPSVDSDSSRSDMTATLLTPPASEFVQN